MAKRLDLTKSLSEMSEDELLSWGAKELAGGFLGGIGTLAFNKFVDAYVQRGDPLSDLFEEQLKKIKAMIDDSIERNELRKLRASADALFETIQHYKNAPTNDRLVDATGRAVELVSQTMSLKLSSFQTFLFSANLNLMVLAERKTRLNQPGEQINIKNTLQTYINHSKSMRDMGRDSIHESCESGLPREIGGTGLWHWIYCLNKKILSTRLTPLGVGDNDISDRFRTRLLPNSLNGDGRICYDGDCYQERKYWITNFAFNARDLSSHDSNTRGNELGEKVKLLFKQDRKWMTEIFETETQARTIEQSWKNQLSTI